MGEDKAQKNKKQCQLRGVGAVQQLISVRVTLSKAGKYFSLLKVWSNYLVLDLRLEKIISHKPIVTVQ